MYQVVIDKPKEKAGFIIFNHLYSREQDTFTIQSLAEELLQYHLELSQSELQTEINMLIEDGVVSQRVGYYKRMATL